jgi:glycine/D-amino acid oxidase-like deaminating enzyme
MDVVVIGAGVIGLSVSIELAKRGAHVTIVERNSPGSGTSATSYGWVNSNNKEPQSYHELNLAGMEAHRRLGAVPDGNWLASNGHIEFATDDAHRTELRARLGRLRERNYAAEEVGVAQARQMIPDLIIPDDCDTVAYFPREAHCFPQLYLAFLLRQATEQGVRIRTGVAVDGLADGGNRPVVALTDGTLLAVDRVVSTVGRWTGEITRLAGATVRMAEFQEPGDLTVGYLAVTNPVPVSISRIVTSPWLNVRPEGGGRLLLQALDLDATADPADVPGPTSEVAKEFVSRLHAVLKNTEGATIAQLHVGQRAMPADGRTVVGPLPSADWLYVVATHSGVTLAPLLGAGVAKEIYGEPQPLFTDFRPDRLVGDVEVASPRTPRKPGEQ